MSCSIYKHDKLHEIGADCSSGIQWILVNWWWAVFFLGFSFLSSCPYFFTVTVSFSIVIFIFNLLKIIKLFLFQPTGFVFFSFLILLPITLGWKWKGEWAPVCVVLDWPLGLNQVFLVQGLWWFNPCWQPMQLAYSLLVQQGREL